MSRRDFDPRQALDDDLVRSDVRISKAISVVIVAAYALAFAFGEPGTPPHELLRMACSAVRG